MKGLLGSLKTYVAELGLFGWLFYIAGLSSFGLFGQTFLNIPKVPKELWLWFGVACLVVAPFVAFHRMRCERDRERPEELLREVKRKVRRLGQEAYDLSQRLHLQRDEAVQWADRAAGELSTYLGPEAKGGFWVTAQGIPFDGPGVVEFVKRVSANLYMMADDLEACDIAKSFIESEQRAG